MQVKIATLEFEIKNTLPGMKEMSARIDEVMQELKARVSHLVVDGVMVTEAPLDYVKQNRKSIKDVEVIFSAKAQKPPKITTTKSASRVKAGPLQVTIANIVFEAARTVPGVEEMFRKIDEYMKDFGVYFSHLVADGSEVSASPREYVEENLKTVSRLEVIFLTAEQYLQQVLDIIATFLEKAVPNMNEVADEFYGKPDADTWERFTLVLQGLQGLVEIVNAVVTDRVFSKFAGEFSSIGTKIDEELHNLKDAAERDDMTQIGDIMKYELVPFVESLHGAVARLLNQHKPETH